MFDKELNFAETVIEKRRSKARSIGLALLVLLILFIGYGAYNFGMAYNKIEVTNSNDPFWGKVASILSLSDKKPDLEPTPTPEAGRLNILVLGLRGADDPNGGLLTDTILLFSYDQNSKKSSLVSIPRDLYVKIDAKKTDKINTVYEYSLAKGGNGMDYTKKVFSNITGTHIDNVVIFDFNSFRKIIDDLGGIDVNLDKPFSETQQWGYTFSLPAGMNHLNGQDALYYARSRYSSNDFDRSRRQQQIIMAIKNKLLQMNFLADPIKSVSILNSLRNDIKTDINIWNFSSLMDLAKQVKNAMPKEYVISTENLVYHPADNGIYILLPKGDNLDQIHQLFQNILQ